MKDLQIYEKKNPEIIFEWHDPKTEAVGWLVINSLKGGAAGGGTRMKKGLTKSEVIFLAKTMEIKLSAAGLDIGGGKSGINFDPNDPRKQDVLRRWFIAITPILKHYYGTGGDLNVSEIYEILPIVNKLNFLHPIEGMVQGHFKLGCEELNNRIKSLKTIVSKLVDDQSFLPDILAKCTVAEMITGYGVAESIKHHYSLCGERLEGKKVLIQGWGTVGSSAGYYLASQGAKIIAITDRLGGIAQQDGFSLTEICALFLQKKSLINGKIDNFIISKELDKTIWDMGVDIFIPAADSRIVTQQHIDRLLDNGLEVISSGANLPFDEGNVLYGSLSQYVDSHISLLPDFIANSGMARVFVTLMQGASPSTDNEIFKDVSNRIGNLMQNLYKLNSKKTHITKTFLRMLTK